MTVTERWTDHERAKLDALVQHFALDEMRDSLRAQITRDYVPASQLRGAVAEIERLRTWIDLQGRDCPSYAAVDLELRDSRARFLTSGGQS